MIRKSEVENDDIRRDCCLNQSFRSSRCLPKPVLFGAKRGSQESANLGVVFDDEDLVQGSDSPQSWRESSVIVWGCGGRCANGKRETDHGSSDATFACRDCSVVPFDNGFADCQTQTNASHTLTFPLKNLSKTSASSSFAKPGPLS
jgi:hypothetical protein